MKNTKNVAYLQIYYNMSLVGYYFNNFFIKSVIKWYYFLGGDSRTIESKECSIWIGPKKKKA